jgi:hypothetical protein
MAKSSSQNINQSAQLNNELQIFQSLLAGQLAGGGIGGVTGATGATGASTGGSSTNGTPSTSVLELLLSIIPIAQEGHVITSEYHNSLRAALLSLASVVGVNPGTPTGPQDVTVTLSPTFFHAVFDPWQTGIGVAGVPQGQATTQGWLPVELPDGALVKSMTVIGRRDGQVATFSVTLERQPVTGGDFDEIITAHLANSAQLYNVTKPFQGTAGLNEIDNKKYQYMIDATVGRSGNATDLIQIYVIQLVYTTG